MFAITDHHEKTETSYYIEAKRAAELNDLLNCHHKTDGKGAHMPVGDILKLKGRETTLRRPCPHLHCLLDCTSSY